MISSDGKTWKLITPKAVCSQDEATGKAGLEEEILPLKVLFLNNCFIALATNTKKEKTIYRSENGTTWYPVGIDASSLHYIHDRLIVEKDLTFSVSADGKKWTTYGFSFPDEPHRHKNIPKESRTVSIVAEDPSTVSFDGDSTRGYYVDSSYVLTDNDRTVGISRDGVHWQVVERPIFKNDSLIENVIGYSYGNHRFVFVTSTEDEEGFVFTSADGRAWEKCSIDTAGLVEEYGSILSITGFERFFFKDSLFFITRMLAILNHYSGGFTYSSIQYISADGKKWDMSGDDIGNLEVDYPQEIFPGEWKSTKLDHLEGNFKLGPDGTIEPVIMSSFFSLLYDKNRFVLPVEYYKNYLQSFDGFLWQKIKWDIDTSLIYTADPYYKETHTFVELKSKKILSNGDDFEEHNQNTRSYHIDISKDKKKWDTVYVDSLVQNSHYSPALKKYPDGLIISTNDKGNWYSSDGRTWKTLDISKSRTDSCRVFAKCSAAGKDLKIYIFGWGETMLSNGSGTKWFIVKNKCADVNAVCFGNGRFVAVGKDGKIWVLEEIWK